MTVAASSAGRAAETSAFGSRAAIKWQVGPAGSVANDPKATFGQTASEAGRAPFLSRMVESATL